MYCPHLYTSTFSLTFVLRSIHLEGVNLRVQLMVLFYFEVIASCVMSDVLLPPSVFPHLLILTCVLLINHPL